MQFSTPKPQRRARVPSDPEAFDLSNPEQYDMVQKMFVSRFAPVLREAGISLGDARQEVLLGLLRKSRSARSQWSPDRGSLSTWMFVAMRGLVLNLIQKEQRIHRRISPGEEKDVAVWAVAAPPDQFDDTPEPIEDVLAYLAELRGERPPAPTAQVPLFER